MYPSTSAGNPSFAPKTAPYLAPQHLALLRDSGLTDATISERGYMTAQFKQALISVGFSPGQARNVPALLIPIYDTSGVLRMYQMRPDAPASEGRAKYMTPAGGKLCLDVPRRVQPLLADIRVPLWITEGSKKVDAAVQHGLCCIGSLGVTGWMRDHAPLPDWQQIALTGRTVYIAFDADARRKRPVWMALQALKAYLDGQGARVLIISLPDDLTAPDRKIGLDDFLHGGGTVDALRALASATLCPCPSGADAAPRNELEKLRASALSARLRGVADVFPHGGLLVSKEATLQELTKAARSVTFFYGRIDDFKKWDLIDLWKAIEPHVSYGKAGEWKQEYFGRYAAQLSNWISKVGAFASNPAARRPHLPFWLHEAARDLTPEQQQTLFDTFEAQGRLSQSEVQRIVDDLRGPQEAKAYKPPTGAASANSSLTAGHWQRLAQHLPESVAEAGLRLLHECGADRAGRVLIAAVEAELSRPEGADAWDAWDVSDTPENDTPEPAAAPEPVFVASVDNEIETSRQTSRRVFTTVKTDAPKTPDLEPLETPEAEAVLPPCAVTFHAVLSGGGNITTPIQEEETERPPKEARLPDPLADLLAQARAEHLPCGREIRLSACKTVFDMNKAVLMAEKWQDVQTLAECYAAWKAEPTLVRTG